MPRIALILALGIAAAACTTNGPAKNVVRLITHSSPGGGSDVFLREIAPHLSRIMGATFVVENLQGGSGAKAMAAIAGAKPDGGMFYATTPTFIYTSLLSQPSARYTDLEPLVNLFFDPEVLYTAADSRFTTLQDVLDEARKGGGKWGAANPASLERQMLERLKQKAMVAARRHHVRRRRRHARQRVESHARHGHRRAAGDPRPARRGHDSAAGGGRRRAACRCFPISRPSRSRGSTFRCGSSAGWPVPRGTPPEVIAAWEAAIPRLLEDPEYKQLYLSNSLQPGFIAACRVRQRS